MTRACNDLVGGYDTPAGPKRVERSELCTAAHPRGLISPIALGLAVADGAKDRTMPGSGVGGPGFGIKNGGLRRKDSGGSGARNADV